MKVTTVAEIDDAPFSLRVEPAIDPKLLRLRKAAEKRAIRKARATKIVRVLNLGAGVQSTAVLLMDAMAHRWGRRDELEAWLGHEYAFDPLDFAVFADTQDEPKAVYEHLARLKAMDTAPILEGTAGRLGDDLARGVNSTGQRFASIPAFTSAIEGQPCGIVKRQCTKEYKVDVVEQIIRRVILGLDAGQHVPLDIKIVQGFGLSWDEAPRIARTRDRVNAKGWSEPDFPLAELVMERTDCAKALASIGVVAPRSACVFCPFRKNAEWRDLRDNDPEGFSRAIEVDAALRRPGNIVNRGLDQKLYLHRSCLPLAIAPIDEPDLVMIGFAQECEGFCGN